MRPVYETEQDIKMETDIAHLLAERFRCEVRKTKKFYHFDYVGIRENNIVSFMEIKIRAINHDKYPTYMISAEKICSCLDMASRLSRPFLLIVSFLDGIFYTRDFPPENLIMGGRFDRGDQSDVEPCVLIPMNLFKKL